MSFAGRMRAGAMNLKVFTTAEIADAAGVQTYAQKKAVNSALRDFLRRGEIERLEPGRYRYLGRRETTSIRQRLWDVARRMTRFTFDDLEQITGADREYIREFCRKMVKAGHFRRTGRGCFQITRRLGPDVPKTEKRRPKQQPL